MTAMELSLDDIIKERKLSAGPTKKFNAAKKPLSVKKTAGFKTKTATAPIRDARNKIIQQKRAKIIDARDRLVELNRVKGDARQRIMAKKRLNPMLLKTKKPVLPFREVQVPLKNLSIRRTIVTGVKNRISKYNDIPQRTMTASRLPDLLDIPRGYVDYDNMERMEQEEYATASRLSRTVRNDVTGTHKESAPAAQLRRHNPWGENSEHFDPFDVYEPRDRRAALDDLPPTKTISRSNIRSRSTDLYDETIRYAPEAPSHLSYEMRSRLKTAPDPHASMGIFANPLKSSSSSSQMPQSSSGYRIVVSNLHNSVTQSDIRELFEDIGELYDSRIVRPGVAEVIYKNHADAENAVDTYHNRQLDGQPMKCLMVNPRASDKPTAPAINSSNYNPRSNSGKTPLEIDIDALHKVLFRR